jgi:hypothetical protein
VNPNSDAMVSTRLAGSLLLLQLFVSCHLSSQTTINAGNVSGVWTAAGSPYLVNGNISVPASGTLLIQPGAAIKFSGHYKLTVSGCLKAIGTAASPVDFFPGSSAGWQGIRFINQISSQDSSVLKFCKLTGGNANGSGDDAFGGAILVKFASKLGVYNCTLAANTASLGGAIYLYYGNISLKNNTINGNSAAWGGGIYSENSSPAISNNLITSNSSTVIGGGGIFIANGASTPTITSNFISFNSASGGNGGGICAEEKFVALTNTVSNNVAEYGGGGLSIEDGTLVANVISSNSVTGSGMKNGGGILVSHCYQLTVSNNFICNNSSGNGAGIFLAEQIDNYVKLFNNVIVNNQASDPVYGGGGIYCWNSEPVIANNTIANNRAVGNGGGLLCNTGSWPRVYNSILYGNTATAGNQIHIANAGNYLDLRSNNIQGGLTAISGSTFSGTSSNNIDTLPLFVLPTAGSGNGFSGLSGDWHLGIGSNCIDRGDLGIPYLLIDKDGSPRIMGTCIDIGAYEFPGLVIVGSVNNDHEKEISLVPNPFSTSAKIMFANKRDNILLRIYNVAGILVRTENFIGCDEITVERDCLPSGIYFYALTETSGKTAFSKFIVTD